MAKRKQQEVPAGTDRLAKLRAGDNTVRSIRARCTGMKRKPEWTLSDLTGFVKGVCALVGIDLDGE
jgi:hypothetical protein